MSGKANVQIRDQDLDCHEKDLLADKVIYKARSHFDQANLTVMTEESFCDVHEYVCVAQRTKRD